MRMKVFCCTAMVCQIAATTIFAQTPIGVIGGVGGFAAYSGLVEPNTTAVTNVTGLPIGEIFSVSMNHSGTALVGGTYSNISPYAALIPSGSTVAIPINNLGGAGSTSAVDINNSGACLIGGQNEFNYFLFGFGALVPSGSVDAQIFYPSFFNVTSVALNDAGVGLIGGISGSVYPGGAAFVIPTSSPLPALIYVATGSEIYSVAINNFGRGLIGGYSFPYAAAVRQDGLYVPLTDVPDVIDSVAINQLGNGVVGGRGGYVGLVASDNTVTEVANLPSILVINSVAINDAGTVLVGGTDNGVNLLYAALVAPGTNTAIPIAGLPPTGPRGEISSVAINNLGIGLIGGIDNNDLAYAALVAPDGTLTQLTNVTTIRDGAINSVAMARELTATFIPISIGNYQNVINVQLAAANTLESHLTEYNQCLCACEPCHSTLWGAPFGSFVRQNSQGDNPTLTNGIGGAVVGYDYRCRRFLMGAGLGYGFNEAHYHGKLDRSIINEELACIYGAYILDNLWINGALWGGAYQLRNKRNNVFSIAPDTPFICWGKTRGCVLTPHLEVIAHNIGRLEPIQPFVRADWVNSWQNGFNETGSSGFNLGMKKFYVSLVRSEAGFRFFEKFWSNRLVLEQKLSYVNRTPFHAHDRDTQFVNALVPVTFPIAIGSPQIEHLAGAELRASFKPWDGCSPYLLLDLQGEFGKNFQSYYFSFEFGNTF